MPLGEVGRGVLLDGAEPVLAQGGHAMAGLRRPFNHTFNFRRLGRIQQYGALLNRLVFLADACVLYLMLYICVPLRGMEWTQRYVTLAMLGIVLFGLVISFHQIYETWRLPRLMKQLGELVGLLALTFGVALLILFAATSWVQDRSSLLLIGAWFLLSLSGMALVRCAARLALGIYRVGPSAHRRVAFLGATETARRVAGIFEAHPWMGVDVAGFFTAEGNAGIGSITGGLDELLVLAKSGQVSAVYIALPMLNDAELKPLVDVFSDTMVSIHYCPALLNLGLLNGHWDDLFGHPVISIVTSPFDGWGRHLKRLEDLTLAIAILPLISIPLVVIALVVRLTSPGPIFYWQKRHGLDGGVFKICKFRTMRTVDADHEFVQARRNDARITPVGRFLRRTSLDELPQFFNVLSGTMSVVGPRPAPLKYNDDHRLLIYRYMLRHKVKPGITGLAQVSGSRGETESVAKTEERTVLDLEYINTWSLWLDLRILFRTCLMVFTEFFHA